MTSPSRAGAARLPTSLVRALAQAGGVVDIAFARGDPMSAGSPLRLAAQLIRREAVLSDAEPLVARQQKLAAHVGRHVPSALRTRVVEFLGELCGVPVPRRGQRAARGGANGSTPSDAAAPLSHGSDGQPLNLESPLASRTSPRS